MSPGDSSPFPSPNEISGAGSGERFAHFVVNRLPDGQLDVLGRGGMGITYRAFDTQLDRAVALKVISPQWMDDTEVRSRFAREARAAARLQHPNIAAVLYQGMEGSACFYAMELVVGETLETYIKRVGPIAPVHALKIARQIALALGAAAKEGVLHRDLKPGNVMLTSYAEGGELHAKVIDFGLAKVLSDVPASYTTGGFVGTPGFASPEQCSEEELDSRSDLYSLGATLWFMVAGRPPFSGSLLAVIQAQAVEPPPFAELGSIPTPLRLILERLLGKFPDERPATPSEAVREIEVVLEALEEKGDGFHPLGVVPAAPITRVATRARTHFTLPEPEKKPSRLLPMTIGVAVVATGAALFFAGRSSTLPPVASAKPTAMPDSAPAPESRPQPGLGPDATPVPPPPPRYRAEWVNSLGMKFVPIPNERVQVSIWETRVRDFETFVKALNYRDADRPDSEGHTWRNPGFPQDPDHPVVYVSVNDASRFCQWLTQVERASGRIGGNQSYRLPTRLEWDESTGFPPPRNGMGGPPDGNGFGGRPGGPPPNGDPPTFAGPPPSGNPLDGQPPNGPRPDGPPRPGDGVWRIPNNPGNAVPPFLWGTQSWPPEPGAGNYADNSGSDAHAVPSGIAGYRDGWAFTAPSGRFRANALGVFDMSGNVWEMIMDGPPEAGQFMMLGGSWRSASQGELRLRASNTLGVDQRRSDLGFRCVLAD